jgi:high-affinity nickel permease
MVPLSFLFGVGFETATEISIMGVMTNNRWFNARRPRGDAVR